MATPGLEAAVAARSRPAVVVTRSAPLFRTAQQVMTAVGAARVVHMSPNQLLALRTDAFWVVDAQAPGAVDLVKTLLDSERRSGMVLSSRSMSAFNAMCVREGVPAMVVSSLVEAPPAENGDRMHLLSPREIHITQLIARGMTKEQMGQELGISPLTAKSHIARIMRKCGARDRANLVLLAMRAGLID